MELANNKKPQLSPKTITLTHSQKTQYFPKNDWILVSGPKEEKYAMHAYRSYCNGITAKVSYHPTDIIVSYSDAKTHRVYGTSSFNLPERDNNFTSLKLNFSFFDDKTKAIIALEDTGFILPVPFKVMYDTTNIKKGHFFHMWFLIKNCINQYAEIEMSPKKILLITDIIIKKLFKTYKRI